MSDGTFIECAMRTDFSDECYGAFGRALSVAQQFEAKCRSLAVGMALKKAHAAGEAGDLDDPLFYEFVDELWERNLGTSIKILRAYGLASKAGRVLHAARIARNRIAHEMTLGSVPGIEDDVGRAAILERVAGLARAVADGDKLAAILVLLQNREPLPDPEGLHDYADNIVKWVCETHV